MYIELEYNWIILDRRGVKNKQICLIKVPKEEEQINELFIREIAV
jgi:hypothetical protein